MKSVFVRIVTACVEINKIDDLDLLEGQGQKHDFLDVIYGTDCINVNLQ